MSGVICAEPFVHANGERKPYLECLQTYFGKTVLPGMRTVEHQSAHSSAGGKRHQGQAHPYLQDQIELCFSVHLNTRKPFIYRRGILYKGKFIQSLACSHESTCVEKQAMERSLTVRNSTLMNKQV